jgi:hypothetical protein
MWQLYSTFSAKIKGLWRCESAATGYFLTVVNGGRPPLLQRV